MDLFNAHMSWVSVIDMNLCRTWKLVLFVDQPCISGLNELDYPSLPEARVGLECLPEISNVKLVPLPPELMEQFARILVLPVIEHLKHLML